MKKAIIPILLTLASYVSAQEDLTFPKKLHELPVTYLEHMEVRDLSRRLDMKERHDLCRLFVKSYVISIRVHNQDYLLSVNTPIYQLFKSNFPEVARREGEGGIFLGQIVRFLNTLPDYKADVEKVLREEPTKMRMCK
jgi:hypothetical protein